MYSDDNFRKKKKDIGHSDFGKPNIYVPGKPKRAVLLFFIIKL